MRHRFVSVAAALLATAAAGCRDPLGADRAVTLPVRDLSTPAELATGAELIVTVTVVTGGCRRFERLVAERATGRLTLVAHGRDSSGPDVACPADIREEPHTYRAAPPDRDPYTVAARQPDGSELTRVVRVR